MFSSEVFVCFGYLSACDCKHLRVDIRQYIDSMPGGTNKMSKIEFQWLNFRWNKWVLFKFIEFIRIFIVFPIHNLWNYFWYEVCLQISMHSILSILCSIPIYFWPDGNVINSIHFETHFIFRQFNKRKGSGTVWAWNDNTIFEDSIRIF